jgi:chromosome segregation ATPase
MTPKRNALEDEEQKEDNEIDYSSPVKKPRKDPSHLEVRSPLTAINKAGKPAEAGIILRIQVINFMCHQNLTVKLCRNVNFIHGQNGSGKSAILAALQICLGANARRTHRARNLKDLVRKESKCNGAKVRVTLLNKGPDAFQPDKYPDSITIEKSISLTSGGFNGYKLLDKYDKEQSRAKKDLDSLLDQLNIQVENPVAVLDQEEAKKFLTGKAEDKYNFFTKATDLERMDRHYATVLDDIQDMEENKLRIQQNLKPLADNVKQLKAEYDELAKLDKLEKKSEELAVKYSWAVFAECNAKLKESKEVFAKIEEKESKLRAEIEKLSSSEGDGSEEETELKNELNTLMEEATEAKEKYNELSKALKDAEAPKKQKERELKHVQGEIATATRNLKSAEQELENYRQEIIRKTGSAQSEEALRASKMKEAEEEIAKLKDNIELWSKDMDGTLRIYEEKEPRENALKSQVESINKQIYAVKSKVQSLQNSEGSSMAMFGSKTIEVYRMVENAKKAGKFRGEVIGPIGNYLKIMQGKEEYAALAEAAFSIKLDRFIVTNDHDRDVFMSIRKQAKCSPRDCGVFQSVSFCLYGLYSN